jgi:hypothetical protein
LRLRRFERLRPVAPAFGVINMGLKPKKVWIQGSLHVSTQALPFAARELLARRRSVAVGEPYEPARLKGAITRHESVGGPHLRVNVVRAFPIAWRSRLPSKNAKGRLAGAPSMV